jgi:hypothetical protein
LPLNTATIQMHLHSHLFNYLNKAAAKNKAVFRFWLIFHQNPWLLCSDHAKKTPTV